jgi:tyrosine-protein kinase Etk/Wzc
MDMRITPLTTAAVPPVEKAQTTDLRGFITNFIYHWPLVLIGLFIAALAFVGYIKLTSPVHEVKATIGISDEKKNTDRHSALKEIDLSNSSTIIENEMAVLQSKKLMSQVVNDLQLWIKVQKKKNSFLYKDIYDEAPFTIEIVKSFKAAPEGNLEIQLKDNNTFLLKEEDGTVKNISFDAPVKTIYGTFRLKLKEGISAVKDEDLRIVFSNPEKLALYYQDAIEVTMPNKLANIISLSLKDPIAQRGEDILSRLIINYQLAGKIAKDVESKRTLDFLNERLASLTNELTDAEKGIETFRVSSGVTDLSSESKIGLENMQANDARLNEIRVQLSAIEGIERFIRSPRNSGKVPATIGIVDPALTSLTEKLSDLQLQRERLLATTPETNPDFEPINRQIAATTMALRDNVRSIKASLQATASNLQSFGSGFQSTIKNIPTQERQYISIKRQQAIKENLYTYLLQKREEVAVSYTSTLAGSQIIDQPFSGPAKVPQKPLALAAALLFGLMIPAGILFSRGALKPRLTDLQQMKAVFGIPVLAELPYAAARESVVINGYQLSPIVDHLRALRIKLGKSYGEKSRGRVTLITSSVPNEGKSFLSTNLAGTIAMSGRRTIILEMDMRKPKIAGIINVSPTHTGVSDYLAGSLRLVDVIQTIGLETNLDVITSGKPIDNSSELLESPRLQELITELAKTYDDIIIDSPPVHLLPDALVLSQFADVTLYVVRQGVTGREEVRFIKELYLQGQLKNMSLVFNGIQRSKYGYGYSYDQSYDYTEQKKISVFNNISDRF